MLPAGAHGVLEEAAELLENLAARLVLPRHGLEDRPQLSHHHGNGVLSSRLSPPPATAGAEGEREGGSHKSERGGLEGQVKNYTYHCTRSKLTSKGCVVCVWGVLAVTGRR